MGSRRLAFFGTAHPGIFSTTSMKMDSTFGRRLSGNSNSFSYQQQCLRHLLLRTCRTGYSGALGLSRASVMRRSWPGLPGDVSLSEECAGVGPMSAGPRFCRTLYNPETGWAGRLAQRRTERLPRLCPCPSITALAADLWTLSRNPRPGQMAGAGLERKRLAGRSGRFPLWPGPRNSQTGAGEGSLGGRRLGSS